MKRLDLTNRVNVGAGRAGVLIALGEHDGAPPHSSASDTHSVCPAFRCCGRAAEFDLADSFEEDQFRVVVIKVADDAAWNKSSFCEACVDSVKVFEDAFITALASHS